MSTYWGLYNTTYNPTGLVGTVGGAADTGSLVVGTVRELFSHVYSAPSGVGDPHYQYRKVHVQNLSNESYENVRIWLDAVEHEDQISVGFEKSWNSTVSSPTTEPSEVDWSSAGSYVSGQEASGVFSPGAVTGVWIRQKLENIQESDPYSSFRIVVGGLQI